MIVGGSTSVVCVVGLDLWSTSERDTTRMSVDRLNSKLLNSCIRAANKYGREREEISITAKNAAQRLVA